MVPAQNVSSSSAGNQEWRVTMIMSREKGMARGMTPEGANLTNSPEEIASHQYGYSYTDRVG